MDIYRKVVEEGDYSTVVVFGVIYSYGMYNMAIRVVEFSNGGYKIKKIFA